MTTVTTHYAKTNLSKLIERARAGEEIVIAKGKKPVARLMPVEPVAAPKKTRGLAGIMKGKWPELPDSFFFDPLPEDELRLWEGTGPEDWAEYVKDRPEPDAPGRPAASSKDDPATR